MPRVSNAFRCAQAASLSCRSRAKALPLIQVRNRPVVHAAATTKFTFRPDPHKEQVLQRKIAMEFCANVDNLTGS